MKKPWKRGRRILDSASAGLVSWCPEQLWRWWRRPSSRLRRILRLLPRGKLYSPIKFQVGRVYKRFYLLCIRTSLVSMVMSCKLSPRSGTSQSPSTGTIFSLKLGYCCLTLAKTTSSKTSSSLACTFLPFLFLTRR